MSLLVNWVLSLSISLTKCHSVLTTLGTMHETTNYPVNQLTNKKRRMWDSNPRNAFGVYTLSKRAPSATRTTLL
jgi:hypothetical protein